MKYFWLIASIIAAGSQPAYARETSPEEILEGATSYTVKIKRVSNIGLNQDEGTSAHATGFLIDKARGWILTNAHVASRSPATLKVAFKGGQYVLARRVFVDQLLDVAVLSIKPETVPLRATAASLECDVFPKVGTAVAVFGHPGDLSYTATRGIISSISWIFPSEVIQSDATINGGNSGGPLIDLSSGKVVGIAAASYRDTQDDHSTAVSMSEPIPPVCQILQLLRNGKNANFRQFPVSYATSEDDDRPIVGAVFEPASGLHVGDAIMAINGRGDVRNTSDLASRLRGQEGRVSVSVRRDGKLLSLETTASPMPDILESRSIDMSGLVLSAQWKIDSREFQHEQFPVIDFVRPGSPAEMTKAYAGYHVASVDNQNFDSLENLFSYLEKKAKGDNVALILKAPSEEGQFYRQYLSINVPMESLNWINASSSNE